MGTERSGAVTLFGSRTAAPCGKTVAPWRHGRGETARRGTSPGTRVIGRPSWGVAAKPRALGPVRTLSLRLLPGPARGSGRRTADAREDVYPHGACGFG